MYENKMERNVSVNDLFYIFDLPYESRHSHFLSVNLCTEHSLSCLTDKILEVQHAIVSFKWVFTKKEYQI